MILNEIIGSLMDQAQERESVSARDAEILREAAKAILNLALSLPNDPLTLDELRQMDGEPVWITFDGTERPKAASHWYLMVGRIGETIIVQGFCETWRLDPAQYGKTWFAYRRKPEAPAS